MFSGDANSMLCLIGEDVAQMSPCSGENAGSQGADSGSQGLTERFKKQNAARVAKAHGSLKLQVLKKRGDRYYYYCYYCIIAFPFLGIWDPKASWQVLCGIPTQDLQRDMSHEFP